MEHNDRFLRTGFLLTLPRPISSLPSLHPPGSQHQALLPLWPLVCLLSRLFCPRLCSQSMVRTPSLAAVSQGPSPVISTILPPSMPSMSWALTWWVKAYTCALNAVFLVRPFSLLHEKILLKKPHPFYYGIWGSFRTWTCAPTTITNSYSSCIKLT